MIVFCRIDGRRRRRLFLFLRGIVVTAGVVVESNQDDCSLLACAYTLLAINWIERVCIMGTGEARLS